ncbi:hypothetical protein SLEP1_g60065 [Rubroshorea leprosula]|uniref:Uncharacterized protein n=1 Tax=Rubroshorea leprosula TaxID=152421 RepID=A0AAV5MUP3_9ROSI|nr:hypothetical protein SLEP1_g60065 [Rubroshorea leprosula]
MVRLISLLSSILPCVQRIFLLLFSGIEQEIKLLIHNVTQQPACWVLASSISEAFSLASELQFIL